MSVQLSKFWTFVLKLNRGFVAWAFSVPFDTPVTERPCLVALYPGLDLVQLKATRLYLDPSLNTHPTSWGGISVDGMDQFRSTNLCSEEPQPLQINEHV
jgi:hypothetical protein